MHIVLFFLTTGGEPFSFREWSERGVSVLSDICDDKGLKLLIDLQVTYNIPDTSFFLYLHIRSAMQTYGVPWGPPLPTCRLHSLLDVKVGSRGLVSTLYSFLQDSSCGPLAVLLVYYVSTQRRNTLVDCLGQFR